MLSCREDFHIHADLGEQFVDRCHVHAGNIAQLPYPGIERLHPAFYLPVEMVNLGLDVRDARAYRPYHELVMLGEASLHSKRDFLFGRFQTTVGTESRQSPRVSLAGYDCVYDTRTSFRVCWKKRSTV